MEFKKTDSKELEKTITVCLAATFILIPLVTFLQMLRVVVTERMDLGEVVLSISAVILIMFDVMMLLQKENRYFTKKDLMLCLWTGSILLSYFTAQNMEMAVGGADVHGEGLYTLLSYVVIAFSASFVRKKENRRLLYIALTIVGVAEVVLSVLQICVKPDFLAEEMENLYFEATRAYGTFLNPTPLSSILAIYLGVECGLFFFGDDRKKSWIHLLLIGLYSFALFLTGTRGGFVGFGAAAVIFSIVIIAGTVKRKEKLNKALLKLCTVILCIVIAVAIGWFLASDTAKSVTDRVSNDASAASVSSLGSDRPRIWKLVWEDYVVKYPVVGVGISNICVFVFNGFGDDNLTTYDAHNRYLHILAEQGIIGIVIYLLLNGYILTMSIKWLKRKERHSSEYAAGFGLLMGYTGYMIADIFAINVFCMVPYLYLLLGLMLPREEKN